MLNEKQRELILKEIWSGNITLFSLPLNLYNDIIQDLQKGVFQGFGGTLKDLPEGSRDFTTLKKLDGNVQRFGAAKTFQQVNDMQNFLLDEQGLRRSLAEFSKDAKGIYNQFNVRWAETEFNMSLAQSQSAAQWNDLQKDKKEFPLLKYQTAGDERVRPLHEAWDGVVKPVDDPFWDERLPPNDYGCRCIVIQLEEGEEDTTNLSDHLEEVKEKTGVTSLGNDSMLFSNNAGKDRFVFDEKGVNKHPYFKVGGEHRELKDRNFNLPLI